MSKYASGNVSGVFYHIPHNAAYIASDSFNLIATGSKPSGTFPSDIKKGLLVCCTATTITENTNISLSLDATWYDLGNISIFAYHDTSKCTAGTRIYLVKDVIKGTAFSFNSSYAYAYGYRIYELK